MKKVFRRRRTWLVIILILIAAPITLGYVMTRQMEWNDCDLTKYFETKKLKPQYNTYETNGRKIFYASIAADTLPMVLFIHGAPGSWDNYVKYFGDSELVSQAHLVALDRPGYGKSGLGNAVTSIEDQAEMIAPLLKLNKSGRPVVVVGHSYGGPIALRLAADFPDEVKAAVLLAPAIDPDNEKMFWVNKPANWPIVQAVMPASMVTAQKEKMSHVEELRKIDSGWSRVTAHTVYMFGDKDGLVPPVNVEYAKRKLINAQLEVVEFPNENHFIPWTQQDSVTRVILRMIGK